jgi:Flp pilus assembly protein TadG
MARIVRKLSASAAAFCRDTSGVILPYVTMMITAIMAVSVLAIDGSRYMSLQSQLQNGADALALVAAAELDQKSDSITRAHAAIDNALVTNPTLYGTVSAGNANVQLPSDGSGIRFLSSLPASDTDDITNAYVTTDPLLAKFVEVTVRPVTLTMILPRTFVAAASSSITTGAVAVAGFPNTVVCNFPPIFVCNPYETVGMTDDQATAAFRTAMGDDATKRKQLRLNSARTGPGQFGYLVPPEPNCNGASCLTDWIARTAPRACYSKAGVDLNTGEKTSVNAAFNVRFDIRTGSVVPDAGHAPAVNVRKGYVWPKSGQKDWCHAALWSSSQVEPQCLPSNTALRSTMALPNDTFSGTDIQGNGIWDCASYWATNHTGAPPTGCSANPTMSRYQIYRYEIDHGDGAGGVGEPTQNVDNSSGCPVEHRETGKPLCAGTSTAVATPDRRNIVVAVINCRAHSAQMTGGSTANNIPVAAFAKYFVTRPVGDDGTNDVYGEFTGFATRADGVVILDQVQLYR